MKALLHKPSEIEIQVKEITLPSVEEIEEEHKKPHHGILASVSWWWLRSPGASGLDVAYVKESGKMFIYGYSAQNNTGGIRPVLRIMNDESQRFKVGDKITVANRMWTAIKPDLFLCDEIVGRSCFREDRQAKDVNDYEKSDVKVWLEEWAVKNGIEFTKEQKETNCS